MSDVMYNSPLAHRSDRDGIEGRSISMCEVSDRGMIDLRGEASSPKFKHAVKAVLGVDLPLKPRATTSRAAITVLWLSVDQWLILCPRDKATDLASNLTKALGSLHSLAVNVSDARAIIRVEGEHAREVLMKGSSVDFSLPDYKTGLVRRLVFAEIAALAHIVSDKPYAVDIYVFRSYAAYAWKWLLATTNPAATIGLFKAAE
jgi:sarcosine oxidase subunit gamma